MKQNRGVDMKALLFFVLLLAMGTMGCKPNETTIEKVVEKPNDENIDKLVRVDETMTDEELADSGEQLLTFYTFPLAEKAFKMALIKNPDNLKAQFYTEGFLKIYTVNKGILNRIKPFIRKQGRLKELETFISGIPNVPARKYLLDGTEDIRTVYDIQDFLFEQQSNWNGFRKWLIKNYDKTLTLNLDPLWLLINAGVESKHACEMIDEASGKALCNYDNVFQKKLGPADLLGLRQMVSGMVLMYTFYTSYNLEGLDKLAQIDPEGQFTAKKGYQYLIDVNPGIFTLRQRNLLKETLSIGSDFVSAIKYARQYQKELCPKGEGATRQRTGFLFHDGICVTDSKNGNEDLELFERALAGPISKELATRNGVVKKVTLDYMAWFRNPPSDLKKIGPASFDACGNVNSLLDKTLGGIYVEKNAEEFIMAPDKPGQTACVGSK